MHVEEFLEAAPIVRAKDYHLENSRTLARTHFRLAYSLDVLMKEILMVDVGGFERLVGRDIEAGVHSVPPLRMKVADALHVEVVQRLQFDAGFAGLRGAQNYFGAFGVARSGSIVDVEVEAAG